MRYAILGDVHANLPAFRAVLEDVRREGITNYVFLGDIVGYAAEPKECLDIVRELNCPVVQGNHDCYTASNDSMEHFTPAAAETVRWTREQLSDEEREYLGNLPLSLDVEGFSIVHASLTHPGSWPYIVDTGMAAECFEQQKSALCLYGHTHVPLQFRSSDRIEVGGLSKVRLRSGYRYLINVGSVGQPRDGDPRASYGILDLLDNSIELRRIEYDINKAKKSILAAGLPHKNAIRLSAGR
ncbi:metallophosphoesterase family protein [Kiritimatiella glycovorans]|uniref:Phosphodiesterase YfcE n=1 Tax=Kiritimatiella glycovorans TaxID=1307763 RepID=A0A0G3ECX1_9BACT|nr:metallophosphoesterase family protein [Kiritimatiella glycovorans]AKJ64306.1 Phosphodiesterase YfcE [Kiritimatiella glycovorans]